MGLFRRREHDSEFYAQMHIKIIKTKEDSVLFDLLCRNCESGMVNLDTHAD